MASETGDISLLLLLWEALFFGGQFEQEQVRSDLVTCILISDWSRVITWPEYWSLDWSRMIILPEN